MKIFFTISLLLFLPVFLINAQESNYISGQVIVQLSQPLPAAEFEKDFEDIGLNHLRLLSKRLNIWLYSYDPQLIADDDVLFRVRRHPSVKVVQFNHTITLRENIVQFEDGTLFNTPTVLAIPNDTRFDEQWAHENTGQNGGTPDADMDSPEAWDITTGGVTKLGDTVVVAIVDGGSQLNHPDLNYWFNWNEIPNNGIDDDNNGYIDDYRGWNAYGNNGNIPSSSHGTHVAGISGAIGNNNIGVVGVNWNVKMMPVAGSSSQEATVVAAYSYIHEMRSRYNETNGTEGAFIVATNSSFGVDLGQPSDYPIWCAMYDSLGVIGVLSCGATANANWDIDVVGDVPTACPSPYMIAVTNTTRNDVKNSGAAYGLTTIDLGAPGTSILSTETGSGYSTKTGTSMATPQVTGAIGLLFAAADSTLLELYRTDPATYSLTFRDHIFDGVDTLSSLIGKTVTAGRLNLFNSVLSISSAVIPVELNSFTATVTGNNVTLSWITSTETNNSGFEVQRSEVRSQSSEGWIEVGFVNGKGTTTELQSYSFIDEILSAGSYNYRIKQLDFDGSFKYYDLTETVEIGAPDEFVLAQNYPNPFNPSTKIKFEIPGQSASGARNDIFVQLKVYDVLGNEVTTLVNEVKTAGSYEVEFNSSSIPSGTYFYQLKAGNFTETKKMMLIK